MTAPTPGPGWMSPEDIIDERRRAAAAARPWWRPWHRVDDTRLSPWLVDATSHEVQHQWGWPRAHVWYLRHIEDSPVDERPWTAYRQIGLHVMIRAAGFAVHIGHPYYPDHDPDGWPT